MHGSICPTVISKSCHSPTYNKSSIAPSRTPTTRDGRHALSLASIIYLMRVVAPDGTQAEQQKARNSSLSNYVAPFNNVLDLWTTLDLHTTHVGVRRVDLGQHLQDNTAYWICLEIINLLEEFLRELIG